MKSNIVIRNLESQDYTDYLSLMREFHGYHYNISQESFTELLNLFNSNNYCNTYVIYENTINKIIGAGSIYKLIKLHNNPVGQIEDVIISDKYRGLGYGKIIINKLCDLGINKFGCYKIILNCLDKNIIFYEKCDFIIAGNEMKFHKF